MNNADDFILDKEDINKMLSKIADMVTAGKIKEADLTRIIADMATAVQIQEADLARIIADMATAAQIQEGRRTRGRG